LNAKRISMALPKGRMNAGVIELLADAGLAVSAGGNSYRPLCSDPRFEIKVLKPQNIVRLVELGSHDVAFAGHDWVVELDGRVIELLDTGLDPVRIVAAMPCGCGGLDSLRKKRLVVASEYERLTREFLDSEELEHIYVRSYGATEVFPPEDADLIVDNTATGRTLSENSLSEVACILESTTRLIACPEALEGWKGEVIGEMVMLLQSVLDARKRVMLEMNVAGGRLQALLEVLPCMREPTVSPLAGDSGYAVKAAVPRDSVARLIPVLKAAGATDLLEYQFSKVVL
jgi:ATP phosphoribosyltransferase